MTDGEKDSKPWVAAGAPPYLSFYLYFTNSFPFFYDIAEYPIRSRPLRVPFTPNLVHGPTSSRSQRCCVRTQHRWLVSSTSSSPPPLEPLRSRPLGLPFMPNLVHGSGSSNSQRRRMKMRCRWLASSPSGSPPSPPPKPLRFSTTTPLVYSQPSSTCCYSTLPYYYNCKW
jgi:hypothetical protein